MAMIDTTRPNALRASEPFYPFAGLTSRALARFATWNERRETLAALRALTPWQLNDVGLSRADVDRLRNR